MRKPVFGLSDQVKHNWVIQPQKISRCLKFWIEEEEGLYYLCSETKVLINCVVTVQLFCTFVLAYAMAGFSMMQLTCV